MSCQLELRLSLRPEAPIIKRCPGVEGAVAGVQEWKRWMMLLRLLLYVLFFAFWNVKMGDPSFLSVSFFFGPVFASSNDCLLLIFFFCFFSILMKV